MKKRFLLPVFSLLAVVSFALVGCGDKAESYALVIECDDAVAKRSVEVDIIGVNPSKKGEVLACSVNDYWKPDDKTRAGLGDRSVTKKFGADHPRRYVMSLKDPDVKKLWADWRSRGVSDIIIIANLKPVTNDAPGVTDPRRKLIPLKAKVIKEDYPDAKAFRVFVQEASVSIDPLNEIPKDAGK